MLLLGKYSWRGWGEGQRDEPGGVVMRRGDLRFRGWVGGLVGLLSQPRVLCGDGRFGGLMLEIVATRCDGTRRHPRRQRLWALSLTVTDSWTHGGCLALRALDLCEA